MTDTAPSSCQCQLSASCLSPPIHITPSRLRPSLSTWPLCTAGPGGRDSPAPPSRQQTPDRRPAQHLVHGLPGSLCNRWAETLRRLPGWADRLLRHQCAAAQSGEVIGVSGAGIHGVTKVRIRIWRTQTTGWGSGCPYFIRCECTIYFNEFKSDRSKGDCSVLGSLPDVSPWRSSVL